MAAKKKSTLAKIGNAVADAAVSVANAANDNVIKPVGRATGLIGDGKAKKPAAKKSAGVAKKATAATKTAAKPAGKPAAKKTTPAAKKPATAKKK